MLVLNRYGVLLRQVEKNDIEQIRVWRNSPEVAGYMEFRDYITPEMQLRWYNSMRERGDLYLMVFCEGKGVGVANLKDIDRQQGCAEWGLFLVGEAVNSYISYSIALSLFDYAFSELGLKNLIAHVFDDNKRAMRYDVSLGFKPTDQMTPGGNRLYLLNKEDYFKAVTRIRRALGLGACIPNVKGGSHD